MAEKPTIELYLYSLNQEFPAGSGHHTFLKRNSRISKDASGELALTATAEAQVYRSGTDEMPEEFRFEWLNNSWATNEIRPYKLPDADEKHMTPLILREEDFGGIAYDPATDQVYKLNPSGFQILKELDAGDTDTASVDTQDRAFANTLRSLGLLRQ